KGACPAPFVAGGLGQAVPTGSAGTEETMDDRWLRSVEELLVREEEEDAPWDGGYADEALEDEYDHYELPADDPRRGTLTEVVLLEGEVIDVRRPPVQGSGYECAALEL